MRIGSDRSAPAAVRAALDELEGINGIRDDVKLVASELVTNAVVHGGGVIDVRVHLSADRLLISVHDQGSPEEGHGAVPTDARSHSGGMGLWIVQRIARRWGSERVDGHRVWAELALA